MTGRSRSITDITAKAFSTMAPRGYKRNIAVLMNYAGVDEDVDIWLGERMFLAVLLAVMGSFIPRTLQSYGIAFVDYTPSLLALFAVISVLAIFMLAILLFYSHLYYVIDERRKRVEAILPDFLLLIAANLRAGMTPISAFVESSMPEFGPLEEEVRIVASRSMGTESFITVFGRLTERIDSKVLKRVVGLFTTGMVSGGHLARLLETSAIDIRETQELKQELSASTRMYVIFVLFIILVGIPLLLSISIQFLVKLTTLKSQITTASLGEFNSSLFSVEGSLEPEFVEKMTYVMLIGTTFFVSILIGVINEGKIFYGLRYFLPLGAIALVDFVVCKSIVEGILLSLA
ncbi:type II secretion system F family protein [Candidatus Micrarchaeota archaeon]|nr:type II secretion system F family protein [Candidatus Micrarchaeota archaeon]